MVDTIEDSLQRRERKIKFDKLCEDVNCLKDEIEKLKNVKMEVCPDCGQRTFVYGSHFCSNCGSEASVWEDENHEPLEGWTRRNK